MTNRFAEIQQLIASLEADFTKFYEKENQAAGTRVRQGMQELKVLAQNIREQIQDKKNEEKQEVAPKKTAAKKK
ncbi:MAG: histone H1 [Bernardetiaceae bacterium]|jgi:hypothetical protein|nr:histone H1 [Bernardetiaceae bacterium]